MGTAFHSTVIVGGGIAGLGTAYHLAQAGTNDVLLLDRESAPGFYASGHNAAIARQLTGQKELTGLTVEGRNRLAEAGLLQATEGLLLGAKPGGLEGLRREAQDFGVPAELGPGAGIPGFRAAEHLRCPTDGVIDIHGLLSHCRQGARDAGIQLRYGVAVQSIRPTQDGFELETTEGDLSCKTLVNAAGAWAKELGAMAGGLSIPFRPLRRHLVWSDSPSEPGQPYAWWVDRPLYLRPESGGLLLCPCDEGEIALPEPGQQPATDADVLQSLHRSLEELAPALSDLPITRMWSGLRTFAPDRRFVIGWDPMNPRLFWVAGLAGHGMTSGLAVGRLAAKLLAGGSDAGPLDPSRFA